MTSREGPSGPVRDSEPWRSGSVSTPLDKVQEYPEISSVAVPGRTVYQQCISRCPLDIPMMQATGYGPSGAPRSSRKSLASFKQAPQIPLWSS